jgi:hypothetical protein
LPQVPAREAVFDRAFLEDLTAPDGIAAVGRAITTNG